MRRNIEAGSETGDPASTRLDGASAYPVIVAAGLVRAKPVQTMNDAMCAGASNRTEPSACTNADKASGAAAARRA